MASELPPASAGQPDPLLAQRNMRLIRRLAIWGGVAAFSLVVAVIVSQTEPGGKRLKVALFGADESDPIVTGAIAKIDRPVLDAVAAKLAATERNTAATRNETKRLAVQVDRLTADSFRFTGRLANIEHQIDGIAGSIKKQAEEAAAAAVAKVVPSTPPDDITGAIGAPVVRAPATSPAKLSLIVPPSPIHLDAPEVTATVAPKTERETTQVAANETPQVMAPEPEAKMAAEAEQKAEPMAAPEAAPMASPQAHMSGPQAEAKTAAPANGKAMPQAEGKAALAAEHKMAPAAKHRAPKPGQVAMQPAAAMKVADASPPPRKPAARRWSPRHAYGVDIGGAESVPIVQAQWAAVKANFGSMLAGMRPTAVRDHRLLGGGSFRLVVGRVHSLKAAERLCTRFARQQVSCQPIEFDDGRVVWR